MVESASLPIAMSTKQLTNQGDGWIVVSAVLAITRISAGNSPYFKRNGVSRAQVPG